MTPTVAPDAALLVLRAVVGITFLLHGLDKLGDLSEARRSFAALGIPAPELMTPLVAFTETIGGLLLIVGLATRLAALALGIDMVVALLTAHIDKGFFVSSDGFEFVLVLGAASFAIALAGAGRFSADTIIGLRERPRTWSRRLRRAHPIGTRRPESAKAR